MSNPAGAGIGGDTLVDGDPGATAPTLRPGTGLEAVSRFGPYDVLGRLAMGGMAEILLAREATEGAGSRMVVLKRVLDRFAEDAAFERMFLDEARIALRLGHPNVCHLYRVGRHDGAYYLAMEWVNGLSLATMASTGSVPVPVACKIIACVADALEHARAAVDDAGRPMCLVHRDVTPHNVMVTYEGVTKLLDFGIAKVAMQDHHTDVGVLKGKVAYMSPEQARGEALDHRSDIFALGACLHAALTGASPFQRANQVATLYAVDHDEPAPAGEAREGVPPQLEQIIGRALAKKLEDRYQTPGELSDALERFLMHSGEVVGTSRIGRFMHEQYADDMRRGPVLVPTSSGTRIRPRPDEETRDDTPVDAAAMASATLDLPPQKERPRDTAKSAGRVHSAFDPDFEVTRGDAGAVLGHEVVLAPVAERSSHLSLDLDPVPWAPTKPARAHPTSGFRQWRMLLGGPKWVRPAGIVAGAVVLLLAVYGIGGRIARNFMAEDARVEPTRHVPPLPSPTVTLAVRSTPPGARTWLDDRLVGEAPLRLEGLDPGEYAIEVEMAGFERWRTRVTLTSGGTQTVQADLVSGVPERQPRNGRLNLETVPETQVYLGGELLGTTPLSRARVPTGLVTLELRIEGGQAYQRRVAVRESGVTATFIDLRGVGP